MIIYGFKHTEQTVEDPYSLGDVDIEPIFSILLAGWLLSILLLSGSSTLRHLRARKIVLYWTGLIGAGLISIGNIRGEAHYTPYWASAHVLKEVSSRIIQSPDLWSTHNCTSQYGVLSPNLTLRTGTQIVSFRCRRYIHEHSNKN